MTESQCQVNVLAVARLYLQSGYRVALDAFQGCDRGILPTELRRRGDPDPVGDIPMSSDMSGSPSPFDEIDLTDLDCLVRQ